MKNKAHIAGILSLVILPLPLLVKGDDDLVLVLVFFFAIAFSIIAGTKASRWWLLVTAFLFLVLALMLWVGFHAR